MDEVVSGFRIGLSGAQGYYGINPILIFNNVSNWPVYATANSLTDAVYVEVWDPYSTYLSIASIIKENSKRKVISLINLSNNNIWNKGKAKPTRKTDIEFKVLIQKDIKGVYFVSADSNNQKMNKLNYEVEETKNAKYIKFTIPSIDYWSIIDIE